MSNTTMPPVLAGQVDHRVRPAWDKCAHEWRELVDSMYSNERQVEVKCNVCGCPGERTIATGEVFWPAT
jgi:hypothetical protein